MSKYYPVPLAAHSHATTELSRRAPITTNIPTDLRGTVSGLLTGSTSLSGGRKHTTDLPRCRSPLVTVTFSQSRPRCSGSNGFYTEDQTVPPSDPPVVAAALQPLERAIELNSYPEPPTGLRRRLRVCLFT
ncbi:jg14403 [Pararge aegeria aegeria]|uniref:Jg14403 protein n=1 Tax=Pararge aegeria aegeria TaxID=348720 RepID=A0A8S4RWK1_9NEOP|nr:jg14403 [Pararge aegeria aegeria]